MTPIEATTANHNRPAKHHFLGWQTPILHSTLDHLVEQFRRGSAWDMRDLIVVLPSGLACRRLAELLALKAQESGAILYPPQIVTVGTLPEHLYVAKFPFASDVVQNLAWMQVLQETPPAELQVLMPVPPAKSLPLQWLELGKMISSVHRELASDRLNFDLVARALGSHPEQTRWATLAKIQRRYFDLLDALELWDIQTARLCALDFNESQTSKKIIVVGCVDLNETQRGFLQAVSEQIEIWIAAPESQKQLFDELGCLASHHWRSFQMDLPNDSLLVGNSPTDQAELTAACLAQFGNRYHAREVTLGVPDSSLIAELKYQTELVGVTARYGPGTPLNQSEPAVLLALIGRYIESRSYAAFAALIRHPAVENLLRIKKIELPRNWLAEIDKYYQATLPKAIDGYLNADAHGATTFSLVTQALDAWLGKLSKNSRNISSFVQPLLEILSAAYQKQTCDISDAVEGPLYAAATQTRAAILALRDIPEKLQPRLTAAEIIEWLVGSMRGQLVPEATHPAAVEMLGWLELALDDSPALIVTGMHDGVVPESVNSDAFLPNNLRRQLGMMDNERRYARDMYSMQVMIQSRQEVRFVVGKTDASGDPLVPSRLLMACALEQLPTRVLHLVREDEVDSLPEVKRRWQRRGGASELVIPRPTDFEAPTKITVTAFRDYLSCPYRFYLSHVRRLRSETDALTELDARQFGNLLHDTLVHLKGSISSCTDAEELQKFLLDHLHQIASKTYGTNPTAAVLIQIEQAELRLSAFAKKQAEQAAAGWEIRFVEEGVDQVDGVMIGREKKLCLIGRIDRIDFHPATGQWAIWDYKSSDTAKKPVSVHWSKKNGWKDLQLPLYREIAKKLGVTGIPQLGYISIPKQEAEIGFYPAEFTDEQLTEADQLAADIASRVAEGDFWPDEITSPIYDDFARICQSTTQRVTVAPPVRQEHRSVESDQPKIAPETVAQAKKLIDAPKLSTPHLPAMLIRASAGTGKTFQLSNRLLQIILSGQEVDPILATTFTRKAAGEIMHRVLQRLAMACLNENAQRELGDHLPGVDTSAANCLAALRRVSSSIHRLRISTLDSFFAQVARTFSLEMALPPGWNAMDPAQEPQFQLQSISRMLDNHEHKTVVNLVRMLAKGESGRQVAEEIRRTVAAGYGPFRITEPEAWDQLPLPKPPSESAVESALLTLESAKLGNKSADNQLVTLHLHASTGNWEAVLGHGIYKNFKDDPPTYYRREIPSDVIVALEVLLDRSAAELLPIRRNQTLASHKVLAAFDAEYTAMVKRYRLLAFSDVTHFLSKWMATDNQSVRTSQTQQQLERERLEFRLDCGVQHLLLDEFQDTAPEQWRILEPLATPLAVEQDSRRSIFCVGDTKQAIYGWRGGVAEVFDSVSNAIPSIQAQELRDSYRSSQAVIHSVNEVFENLTRHPNYSNCDRTAADWATRFPPHRTARHDLPGYVRLQNGPDLPKEMSHEEKRNFYLEFTANQIAELTAASPVSVGVLFRTNADVARMIAILRDKGVSASQDGGNPLTDSAAVELVLSLVHLADHPGDSKCLFHVATSPLADLIPISDARTGAGISTWFRSEVARRGLGNSIATIADCLADKLSWWDQHRLEQLIRLAFQFQNAVGGRLREFEEMVEFQRIALPTEAQVKVMTVHKSKGLEYDAVFLPDLQIDLVDSNKLLVLRGKDPCQPPDGILRYMNAELQAILPANWQRAFEQNKQRSLVESLCLLYVAMTRAKCALYMTTRPGGKKATQQFSSLLQSTLGQPNQVGTPEVILFEEGDPNWFKSRTHQHADSTKQSEASEPLGICLRTDSDSAPARGLRVTAPSYIGQSFTPISLASAFSYSESVGATYGTLIHAFFEQIQWIDDYRIDRDNLRKAAMASVSPEELQLVPLDTTIDDFERMLQLRSVREILSRARYTANVFGIEADSVEIDNERMLSLIMDSQLVSGTIDRLVVLMKDNKPYAAEIIDYKTDALDPKMQLLWLDDRVEHHRSQLDVYAQVISELFQIPGERIATYLVMLSSDDLVRVDQQGRSNLAAARN